MKWQHSKDGLCEVCGGSDLDHWTVWKPDFMKGFDYKVQLPFCWDCHRSGWIKMWAEVIVTDPEACVGSRRDGLS